MDYSPLRALQQTDRADRYYPEPADPTLRMDIFRRLPAPRRRWPEIVLAGALLVGVVTLVLVDRWAFLVSLWGVR